MPQMQAMEAWTLRSELSHHDGGSAFIERVERVLPEVRSSSLMKLESRLWDLWDIRAMEELQMMKITFLHQEIIQELQARAWNMNLNSDEVQAIESEILSMQRDFLREFEASFKEFMTQVADSIGTREIWNLEGELFYSIPFFGELEMKMSLSDYIADTESLVSSRVRGDVAFSLDMFGEKIESSMMLDIIVRDANIYLLVKDISLSGSEMLEEWSELIQVMNALGKNNTYIHIWNETEGLNMNLWDILSLTYIRSQEWYRVLDSQALLTPVGKIGDTYFMSAHEEMCHLGKALTAVFDPFSGSRCSARQLENFRNDMQEILDIRYTKSGRVWDLRFHFISEDMTPSSHITLRALGGTFGSLEWKLENSWDMIYFSGTYVAGKNLALEYSANSWGATTEFWAEFGFGDNTLKSMNITWNYSDSWSEISSQIELKDEKISGNLVWIQDNEEFVSCTLWWGLQKNYLSLEWSCNIQDPSEMVDISGKLEYDTRDNSNNFHLSVDGQVSGEDFMKLHLKNTATRQALNTLQIRVPAKTIDIETLMERVPAFQNMFLWLSGGSTWDDDWEWEADYEVRYSEWDDYSETCYDYDNGEVYCYKYYDDGTSESCADLTATSWESYCSYSNDEYYYDGERDIYYYFEGYQIDGKTGERTEY
jgi:hypothetical protein